LNLAFLGVTIPNSHYLMGKSKKLVQNLQAT